MDADDVDALPEDVERQIMQVFDLPESDWDAAVHDLCLAHPGLEPEIRMSVALRRFDHAESEPVTATTLKQIGPYRLERVLGEGGMGTVWLATQEQPVRRRVAIKLVKPGLGSREIVKRFEAERQALAMMEHSNIARVFGGGLTSDGRSYFVMEYVEGQPIHSYCEQSECNVHQRLELLAQVCSGVAHAHQKGVIHRDLKPSNILVALEDGLPRVKIIDFGLARAVTGQRLANTMLTMQGQIVGTPAFMSPEQATFAVSQIDTRTDVYSIGVVAYLLLTGELPFTFDEGSLDIAAIQRRICEEEPQRPSLRVANRVPSGRSSTQRSRALRGELDWITMRAMEKSVERRYASAEALGSDIRRYLDGMPVEARPASAFYYLTKLARRNRAVVTGAAIAVLALVAASATSISFAWQAIEDRHSLEQASKRTEKARQDAESVADFQGSVLARVRVRDTGRTIVDQLRRDLMESGILTGPEVQSVISAVNPANLARRAIEEALLGNAVEQIETQFAGRPLVGARLYSAFAQVYLNLGSFEPAITCCRRALRLRRENQGEGRHETIGATGDLGSALMDARRFSEALPLLESAYAGRLRQTPQYPELVAEAAARLASTYAGLGEFERSAQLADEATEIWRETGQVVRRLRVTSLKAQVALKQGRQNEAMHLLEGAYQEARMELDSDAELVLMLGNNLGLLLRRCGQVERSIKQFRELLPMVARAFGDDDQRTVQVMHGLGMALLDAGDASAARAQIEEALRRLRKSRVPGDPFVRRLESVLKRLGK